jgi:hypothetical protein
VPLSFGRQEFLRFPPTQYGLRWYVEYFSRAAWLEAAFLSLRIALFSFAAFDVLGTSRLDRAPDRFRANSLCRCAQQRWPHSVLALLIADMVRSDHRHGRTVNRVTESVTRPLFQEELRPGNDEVAR